MTRVDTAALLELEAKATPGLWRVGRQDGAPKDHLVDMGEPPSSPYFRMHKGTAATYASSGVPAFGIVESDDAQADEIAANAALIVEMRNAIRPLITELEATREALRKIEREATAAQACNKRNLTWASHNELATIIQTARSALEKSA